MTHRITLLIVLCALLLTALVGTTIGQTAPVSERMAATAMNKLWRDAAKKESGNPAKWAYDHGLVLKGIGHTQLHSFAAD